MKIGTLAIRMIQRDKGMVFDITLKHPFRAIKLGWHGSADQARQLAEYILTTIEEKGGYNESSQAQPTQGSYADKA